MDKAGKHTTGKRVILLPMIDSDGQRENVSYEQYRKARLKQARAQAFWAGRNHAMRRSGRRAA